MAWTAYPTFVGSVASTLAAPFFIAALGIILRGASYALRSAADTSRESRMVDAAFAVASLVTPFALGTMAGAIAAERVPVGNAAGDLFSSWTGAVPILIGALAVTFSAYLAAVYLAADAARHGDPELEQAYRVRALGAGVAAGALAIVGLVVLHADAHSLYTGLVHGAALAVLIVSLLAGAAALALVATRRFEPARYVAALAVAAVVAGWAFARYPALLPGLTVSQAAAPHDTLVAVVIAVLAGGAILFPSLGLLFGLLLRGRLGEHGEHGEAGAADADGGFAGSVRGRTPRSTPLHARVAVALLIAGVGFLNAADAGWAHLIGVFACSASSCRLCRDRAAGAGRGHLGWASEQFAAVGGLPGAAGTCAPRKTCCGHPRFPQIRIAGLTTRHLRAPCSFPDVPVRPAATHHSDLENAGKLDRPPRFPAFSS